MRFTCTNCQKEFSGREGKRFCSVPCKNAFNNERRKKTRSLTADIDGYLHRNHEILTGLCVPEKTKKFFFDKGALIKEGFRFEYLTGIYTNNVGKRYHYIYNYAWMEFSTEQVMVIVK